MKTVGIEALLRWAYVDELPHGDVPLRATPMGPRPAWAGMSHYAELLAVVDGPDVRNIFGVVPSGLEREPHPDAVKVFDAVTSLEGAGFDIPEGWHPGLGLDACGDLGADAVRRGLTSLITSADGVTRLRRPLVQLVHRHVLCGGTPPWEAEAPVVKPVTHARGEARWFISEVVITDGPFGPVEQVVEVDGFDAKRRRPMRGAYQKHVLSPDPAPAVAARAEYGLWHAAMVHLADALWGTLASCEVAGPNLPALPWDTNGDAPGLVLRLACSTAEKRNADAA